MADFGPMSKLRDKMATGTDRGYGATLAIFGGSGATGRLLVQTSLAQGYKVRALVRNAASLNLGSDGLTVITGSVLKGDDVANCLNGCDAVICVLGPRPPYTDIFCQAATATIVESMQACGIKRLVVQTGGMIGDYPANRSLPFRLMTALFNNRLPAAAADRKGQEESIKNSRLDWTIVKPSRLTLSPAKNHWSAGSGLKLGMLSSISRTDLANFLLSEAVAPKFTGMAVFIKN